MSNYDDNVPPGAMPGLTESYHTVMTLHCVNPDCPLSQHGIKWESPGIIEPATYGWSPDFEDAEYCEECGKRGEE